jgi:hypothetical protein
MYNMYEDDDMSAFEEALIEAICTPIDNTEDEEDE